MFLFLYVANGLKIAKDYERAKIAYEKASKGHEMLSSYPSLPCFILCCLLMMADMLRPFELWLEVSLIRLTSSSIFKTLVKSVSICPWRVN